MSSLFPSNRANVAFPITLCGGHREHQSAVAADGSEANFLLLKEQRALVEPVYPAEGTPLVIAPSAVFRNAPSPNAARLFASLS